MQAAHHVVTAAPGTRGARRPRVVTRRPAPPRCSVVVPTYRRHELLRRCLVALADQRLSATEYEVIVADDANNPSTRALVEALAGATGRTFRYVAVAGAAHGPAAARNRGWRATRGAVIAFTDDDTIPDPDWLSEGLGALHDLDAAWGRIDVPLGDTPTDYERDAAGLADAGFVTANCFCTREALARVGGFDERYRAAWREDSDLFFRLLEHGMRVARVPRAAVRHPVRPARWGVSVRQQRKSRYDALLWREHRDLFERYVHPARPTAYYPIVVALGAAAGAAVAGRRTASAAAFALWGGLTARFTARRLRGTSHAPAHVAEMVATSMVIPPLSLFWRLWGAVEFRTWFW